MEENNAIVKTKESSPLDVLDEEITLSIDVTNEMQRGYDLVQEIIDKIYNDTRTDDVLNEDGEKIGQRTHLHPQLLKWMEEARKYQNDIWKLGGGELTHEAEKKKLEIKAQLLMKLLSKTKAEREEIVESWKQSVSFKK